MTCPLCSEPTEDRYRPFCSRRCADIDLGRWMLGSYAIPMEEEELPDDADRRPLDRDPAQRPN